MGCSIRAFGVLAAWACGMAMAQPGRLPAGRPTARAVLDRKIHQALPAEATQVNRPLPVQLDTLGKVDVVLYRRGAGDPRFHGIVLVPNGSNPSYRALPLPDEEGAADSAEQITTAILAARTSGRRALVILFYTHRAGRTDSDAFGRVYRYENGGFRVDVDRSHLLDGVRTAAVVRLRLAQAR